LEKNGAGVVIYDRELTGEKLLRVIQELVFDKERLSRMSEVSRSLARPEALENIVNEIKKLID
jgi:UDP-N-acetylglucosamine--N-acetylmuramyl-(pentapeptide) pyrophosphoryl-undecaprenol N-acetylglucosamine transferase